MSPEKQRIAIAEAYGWKDISDWGAGGINGRHPVEPWTEVIPDYLNDLNAMHEAERVLSPTLFAADSDGRRPEVNLYLTWLTRICGHSPIAFATAAQRAEAFLRTLNLWEEPK